MPEFADDSETQRLVRQAATGDQHAWTSLLTRHRPRLRCLVAMRMDRRLRGRLDPSDIIQEANLVAAKQFPAYASNPRMSFYLWLRWLTGQRLIEQHRRHLGAQARELGREISLYHAAIPEASSADLAAAFLGHTSSPSQAAVRIEQAIKLEEALNSLEPLDREILALRHFEQLSNGEAAEVLAIDKSAASKRYARALVRLKDLLVPLLGGEP